MTHPLQTLHDKVEADAQFWTREFNKIRDRGTRAGDYAAAMCIGGMSQAKDTAKELRALINEGE